MGPPGAGSGRLQRIGDYPCPYRNYPPPCPPVPNNYLNCATPRSRLVQNCAMINQIQQELPPYPKNLGIYGAKTPDVEDSDEEAVVRPDKLELPELPPVPADKLRKHPGILKNYKSCPVSPVHEEQEWSLLSSNQDGEAGPSDEGAFHRSHRQGRHSMYYEDAKTILDMIHSDTEKMIKEITSKYGDLDELDTTSKPSQDPQPRISVETGEPKRLEVVNKTLEGLRSTARKERHEHGFLSEDDPNFSSDSLEDCSLDLDVGKTEPGKSKRNTCAKHGKPPRPNNSLPKRSVSDYFIYDSFQPVPYRNVSLSDILDEDKSQNADNRFLETQRHSSASFFLGQQYPDRKSQESILSDDFGSGGVSYCNSMESILSDDSECKSAPLEVLFGRIKRDRNYSANYEYKIEPSNNSKSYGSSPNATSGFDYYMQEDYFSRDAPGLYAFENLDATRRISESRSPQHKRQGAPGMPTSISYPRFISSSALAAATAEDPDEDDFIPTLTSKAAQYGGATVKSLSKDFANQRKQMNSNPLYNCEGNELFVRKTVNATNQITRSDIFGNESSVYVMKKSCSFEIEMGGRRIARNSKKFEQNLQRFEQERQLSDRYQMGGTLEMEYVPHKPPVAHRRSASMKGRGRARSKEKFNTIIGQISGMEEGRLRDFVNKDYMPKDLGIASCSRSRSARDLGEEKSFEIYVAEKGVCEDDNMDSLELLAKPDIQKQNSVDSLDDPTHDGGREIPVKGRTELEKLIDFSLMSSAEYSKFLDIEKKIDIINKLVEMEERKLEQERVSKENRMKPFECDSRQKGYVKSLTENFDKIAKDAQEELENEKNWHLATKAKMKRNFSLPDVLEGAKFQPMDFGDDDEDLYKQKDEEELSEKDEHSLGYAEGEGVTMM